MRISLRFVGLAVFAALMFCLPVAALEQAAAGRGVSAFLAKLAAGRQVNVVAIGGSITMHRTGWALRTANLMRESYPAASVNFINAGVSGTGSNLGVFRLDRDVIAARPDIVFVEFAVNDGGALDESCVRDLESIVVKLLKLKNPPAVVFVQSAAENGVTHKRHNLVAGHYNLLAIDMQSTVGNYIKKHKLKWNDLFSDSVHPNDKGHEVYASKLWSEMRAYAGKDGQYPPLAQIKPVSKGELILNGTLLTPNFQMQGWHYSQEKLNGWWRAFFEGSMKSLGQGSTFHMPFYGRTIGLWLLIKNGNGKVRIAVDGQMIGETTAFRPKWYYNVFVYDKLLENRWHSLSIIPVSETRDPPKVRIGYFLLEDQVTAPAIADSFWDGAWKQRDEVAREIKKISWEVVPVEKWQVLGAFGRDAKKPWLNPQKGMSKDFGVDTSATAVAGKKYATAGGEVEWRKGEGENGWLDLQKMFNTKNQGIAYAQLALKVKKAGVYDLMVAADYFVYGYVNGQQQFTLMQGHGRPRDYVDCRVKLKKGVNNLMFKIHAGSMGFGFKLRVPIGKDVEYANK